MADDDQYITDAPGEGYEGVDDVDAEGIGEVEFAEGDGKEGDDQNAELAAMRAKLRQMEEEAAKLREMQAKVGGDTGTVSADAEAAAKEEADSRSVYVGQVDYGCTPEELQLHFQGCGTVNRVTILTDQFGNPKGFAYIEFLEADAVPNAVLLDGTELRGRQIKVTPKRTNVPGFGKRGRGGRRGGHRGGYYGGGGGGGYYGGRGGYYAPYRGRGYGPPRGRGRGRFYSPY